MLVIPDLITSTRLPGTVRLYDCFFSDQHQWTAPSPSEVSAPSIELIADRLSEQCTKVLTVLAAFYHIAWDLAPKPPHNGYWAVITDGSLHSAEILGRLAQLRIHVESAKSLRAMDAGRELGALLAGSASACASEAISNWLRALRSPSAPGEAARPRR